MFEPQRHTNKSRRGRTGNENTNRYEILPFVSLLPAVGKKDLQKLITDCMGLLFMHVFNCCIYSCIYLRFRSSGVFQNSVTVHQTKTLRLRSCCLFTFFQTKHTAFPDDTVLEYGPLHCCCCCC